MKFEKKLWIGLLVLIILSPLGIILPMIFDAGDAWGEWSVETVEKLTGFIPEKLKADSDIWHSPIPDYNLGNENSSLTLKIVSYIFSGLIGVGLICGFMYLLKKIIKI
jgi:cobalt/nickel transport protein